MLSINPCNSIISYKINNPKHSYSFWGTDVSDLMSNGDKALNENRFDEALKYYSEAKEKNSEEIQVYKKLGKTYANLKKYTQAQENYQKYIDSNPSDSETLIELGEAQRKNGFYKQAQSSYEKALALEPNNDYAKRCLLEVKNDILYAYSPTAAIKEKNEYASKNLNEALNIAINYLSPAYMKDLADIQIMFGETAEMSGTANIAQYENYKKAITVSDKYIYAAPQVIAAYLVHETVHAKDKDPYTSVREEQDAYQTATKFWIQNSNGIQDPEMDYAADLYKKSPSALNARVEEIYKLRDPGIADTSPNHPPQKIFHFNKSKSKAAMQTIKKYDVIA